MKNSSQIIGLPIIIIADGVQVGKVKTLVINPEKGSIDFLTIDHEDWQVSIKAIPFKKVIGIGEYAVTVESENAIIDLNEIPIANQLVNKNIKITSTKVMTRKGELLGEAVEYFADENTGNILGMEVKIGEKRVALLSEYVLTYGKDIIIVKEEAVSNFFDDPSEFDPVNIKSISEQENDNQDSYIIEEVVIPPSQLEDNQEIQEIKEKQREILIGKKILKDIFDNDGTLLISSGTVLTLEDIEKVQDEEPSVLIELSMNIEA